MIKKGLERIARFSYVRTLRVINRFLSTLELNTIHQKEFNLNQFYLNHRPIFIIGAPRSGSTLLYQVLTEYFEFGYLSNMHCQFYGGPSLIERWFAPLRNRQSSDYVSHYGITRGWTAPSECGEYWYRFFRRKPQYVSLREVDPQKMTQMRLAVFYLTEAFNKPVLFKNMNCALRLEPIIQILPEALFIVTSRNLIDNACSLLQVRQNVFGNYATWWSMEPPGIEQLKKLPEHKQVIEQVRLINNLIEDSKVAIGSGKFLTVNYEDFCDDTFTTLSQVENFLNTHHVTVKIRNQQIPAAFIRQQTIRIPSELYQKLVEYGQTESQ